MKKFVFLFLAIFAGFSLSSAAVENAAPKSVVEKLIQNIKSIKEDTAKMSPEEAASNEKRKNEANSLVDVPWLAEWSLGTHWEKRTDKEKKVFSGLVEKIFKNVAYPKSGGFFRDLEVNFDKEKVKDDTAVVSTTIVHKKEGEIEIEFKLRSVKGNWLVYDVILDGVSLGRNLKTKFQQIIQDNSYAELVRRLEKKLDERAIPEGLL